MPSFKDVCSEADLRRFAICFLHAKDHLSAVDWDAAAAEYDPKVKVASFKTVTTKALKKAWEAAGGGEGGGEGEGDGDATTPKAKTKPAAKGKAAGAGKKRKAADGADGEGEGDDEEKKPAAKKAKGGKRGKKPTPAASDATDGEDGENIDVAGGESETAIKAEEDNMFN